jgi:glycosyltransferase involved in cell wall biosynthesis
MSGGPEAPAVTVLLPTLNRRQQLLKAVESVLVQTRRDFELIVVDGGSSDGTAATLKPLLGDNVRLLTVPGIGVSAARNRGLESSLGEIVTFLDSDNVWRPHHLELVTGMLKRHPSAVLASTCPCSDVGGADGLDCARLVDPLPRMLIGNDVGWVSCVGVRRSALEAVGGFDERLVAHEGSDLWRRLALHGDFVFLRHKTVEVRRTRGSLSDVVRERGDYFELFELSAEGFAAEARRLRRTEVLEPARGLLDFARALRAAARDDPGEARAALRDAVDLLPALSREPDPVLGRIRWFIPQGWGAEGQLRVFGNLADGWPDVEAETALRLRGAAAIAALRAGRPARALALLGTLRPASAARLAARGARGLPSRLRSAVGRGRR